MLSAAALGLHKVTTKIQQNSSCSSAGNMTISRHASREHVGVTIRPSIFSGATAEPDCVSTSASICRTGRTPVRLFVRPETASGHTVAETCGARLRAMLRLAMREDGRLPIEREGKRLSFECWRLMPASGDLPTESFTKRSTSLPVGRRQPSEDSGFLFLSGFTDASQSKRGLGCTDLFLGGFFSFLGLSFSFTVGCL